MSLQRQPETQENIASLLPTFDVDDEGKRTFLSFRICGFTIEESLRYTGILIGHLERWNREDEIFQHVHTKELARLQRDASESIIELERLKNHRLALAVDSETLDDAVTHGLNSISERQFEHLKSIKNKYDSRVTSLLGLEPGDKMPLTMDELTIRFRRIASAEHVENGDQHDSERPEAISTGQEPIIEADYKESPSKPDRNKGRKASSKKVSS